MYLRILFQMCLSFYGPTRSCRRLERMTQYLIKGSLVFCFVWSINHIGHSLFCFRFIFEKFHDIIWNAESICSIFWFVMMWFNHMWIFMDTSDENVIRIHHKVMPIDFTNGNILDHLRRFGPQWQQFNFILMMSACHIIDREWMSSSISCMTCATDNDDICGDGNHICCFDNSIKTCEALLTSFEFLYDLIFHSMIRQMKLAWEIKTINCRLSYNW